MHLVTQVRGVFSNAKILSELVIPDFYFVVVPSRNKQRLSVMKIYTTNRTLVFLKPFQQGSNAVVPKLYYT